MGSVILLSPFPNQNKNNSLHSNLLEFIDPFIVILDRKS